MELPNLCKRKSVKSSIQLQERDSASDLETSFEDCSGSEWEPDEHDMEESEDESCVRSKEIIEQFCREESSPKSHVCPDSRSCSPTIPNQEYPMLMHLSSPNMPSSKEQIPSQLSIPLKESIMTETSSSPNDSISTQMLSPKDLIINNSPSKKIVVGTHKNVFKKRVWDKKHVCVYCLKAFSKLSKHLSRVHSNEIDVAKAFSFKKNSRERKVALKQLTNRGDFLHNHNVAKAGKGELIAVRRPKEQESCKEFTTCDGCFGLYKKHDLWRHKRQCNKTLQSERKSITGQMRQRNIDPLFVSGSSQQPNSLFITQIINKLAPDLVTLEVKQDPIICQMGENLFRKSVKQTHQHQYIRQKMRELGKFLIEMKKIDVSSRSISDCIDPVKFNKVVTAVKTLTGFDEDSSVYGVPSLALKLGYSLQMCAHIVKSNALKEGNDEHIKRAESFLVLYKTDWAHDISSTALNTLHGQKFNKAQRIPLAQDLKKMYDYLDDKVSKAKEEMRNHPSPESWRDLAEGTLAQVSLFNRRRGGEMQRMELQQYQCGLTSGRGDQEVLQSLTPLEKRLAAQLHRVEIRGKRGRRVPVLLTQRHKESIDLLLDFREASGIPQENKFVFALCEGTLRTSDVLRKYAQHCGASRPDLLTTTSLRKHIATISQLLNLKDNELDALASFMGHDIRVHRNFYRLPEDTYQIAKVSKVLLHLEQGKISSCSGKSLDDITLNENEEVEYEQIDSDDYEASGGDGESDVDEAVSANQTVEHTTPSCFSKKGIRNTKKVSQVIKRPWNEEEESAVQRCLGKYFGIPQLPGKSECLETLRKESALRNRTWVQIKSFIRNRKVSLQRRKL